MNTSYLKTFIEVINLRNISKAAEKLFVTQPAVSKQLQILEKDFGSVLFKKNGREIVPTEEGIILYKFALNVLNEENKIYSKLKKDDNLLSGELIIYSSSLPAEYYIQNLIIEFSKDYPEIKYIIKKVDSKKVYTSIEEGFTNFGFTGKPYKNHKIKSVCIAEDEVILVCSKQIYEKFENQKLSLDILTQNEFILRESGSATLQIFEEYLNKNKIKIEDLKIKIQAEDNEAIKTFAKNGMGIAVLPKISVEKELAEHELYMLDMDNMNLKRELYYVYYEDRYFSKIEEKFKEYMLSKYSKTARE